MWCARKIEQRGNGGSREGLEWKGYGWQGQKGFVDFEKDLVGDPLMTMAKWIVETKHDKCSKETLFHFQGQQIKHFLP